MEDPAAKKPKPDPVPAASAAPAAPVAPAASAPAAGGKALDGMTVCVSGQMSMVRKQFQELMASHGARISNAVTGKCSHLVTTSVEADNPTRKVLEAMKKGTIVVGEAFVHEAIAKGSHALVDAAPHSTCLLYTSPSPRDRQKSRMPSSA